MTEKSTPASERMDVSDFAVRLISVLGLVGAAFAILLAVRPA